MKFSDLLAACRKRVRRVQADRDQQGPDVAFEVLVHPVLLGGVADAVGGRRQRLESIHEEPISSGVICANCPLQLVMAKTYRLMR